MKNCNKACFDCGDNSEFMHHVVPRSQGGTKMIPLCGKCHGLVHSKKFTSIGYLTSIAMQHMKAAGMYTGGKVQYGFQVGFKGQLVEFEPEQNVLALVRNYRQEGLSLRKIANILSERGIRSRSGKAFHFQAVQRLAL